VCTFSLRNKSDKVRWSIDLRWQSPHENWGFYGIAEGILLRSADQSRVLSDWNKFLSVNRKEVWQKRHFSKVRIIFAPTRCSLRRVICLAEHKGSTRSVSPAGSGTEHQSLAIVCVFYTDMHFLCTVRMYTMVRAVLTNRSTASGFDRAWFSFVFRVPLWLYRFFSG